MRRTRIPVGVAVLAAALASPAIPAADAANSPTFRDCSLLVAGVDPDFVEISGVTVGSGGALTVKRGTNHVNVLASESSDPGDMENSVTLTVTVTSPGIAARTVSGAAVGKVMLAAPLRRSHRRGRTYTVEWAATFDNGGHLCPSANTPENTAPNPFVVTVG
jgi:hypothetical protein